MARVTFIPDPEAPSDWQLLLRAILEPLGTIHGVDQNDGSVVGFTPGEPVIVAAATVPPALAAVRHDSVILAPSPFASVPVRFPASPPGVRVLSFNSACHAAAQRAGLRSALFQYFPEPEPGVSPADRAVRGLSDCPSPPQQFSLDSIRSMARGACVCCAESPLALDYIVDGVNGFIGDVAARWTPAAARAIGAAAHLSVRQGFNRWQKDQARLAEFVFAPTPTTSTVRLTHAPPPAGKWPSRSVTPVVTVATVVRNASAELRATLPSILGQRFTEMEVVLFDGGSTDETLDVIREHAAHIHYWTSAPDGGPYDAMQKAVMMARGRWILFMNAGDRFVDTDALGRLVEAARDDADVVAGHHVYIDSKGIESIN
ncbi:MAG: glycosyltransferase, partial [Planctomycetia bacterium]